MFNAIRIVVGLRVSPEAERIGLDVAEHGNDAYPEFGVPAGGGGPKSIAPPVSPITEIAAATLEEWEWPPTESPAAGACGLPLRDAGLLGLDGNVREVVFLLDDGVQGQ